MTYTQKEAQDRLNWIAIAKRVVDGEFDEKSISKVRKTSKRLPPQGSLAESLTIGLRGYSKEPVVTEALDHIRNPE